MATKEVSVPAVARNNEHGFSGKTVTVEFMRLKDTEPTDIFVGVNNYQARIKRGTVVTIPEEVFEVLKEARYTDQEDDPDRPGHKISVEKQRYPFNVHSKQ